METLEDFSLQICDEIAKSLAEGTETDDAIHGCGEALVGLLRRQANIIRRRCGHWELLQRRLDDVLSVCRTKFYAYPFADVPPCWMRLFTDASILAACAWAVRGSAADRDGCPWPNLHGTDGDSRLGSVVAVLDMAVIMAGALGVRRRAWIERFLSLMQDVFSPREAAELPSRHKRRRLDVVFEDDAFPEASGFVPPVRCPIDKVLAPSMESFEKHMQQPVDLDVGPRPMVIQRAIEHWPARNVRSWSKPSYLLSKTFHGCRLIPIETGRSYVDEGWGQAIITFKEFLDDYVLRDPNDSPGSPNLSPSSDPPFQGEKTGYLAQHDLFTQIPSLRADISVPDYCYTKASLPHHSSPLASRHAATNKLEDPLLNAWFGPAGTISPLHTDPYHNILAQVVGTKYIRLYAPKESKKLYARGIEDGGIDMCNTSALDIGLIEGWDFTEESREDAIARHPLYFEADYVDVILEEGECLYIPLGWWHYVRSLTVSFSVSFWWN